MEIVVLGIELGKKLCSVVGLDAGGQVVLRRRDLRAIRLRLVDTVGRLEFLLLRQRMQAP